MILALMNRSLWTSFGELMEYPRAGYLTRLAETTDVVRDLSKEAASRLTEFQHELDGLDDHALEELFARTFDFAPLCNAYVSVHLFGDESFKRSQLMTGLAEAYERANFNPGPELPDHMAVILRFAPNFSDEEWSDMNQYCLRPTVSKMLVPLERASSPYRHLLKALALVLDAEFYQETLDV